MFNAWNWIKVIFFLGAIGGLADMTIAMKDKASGAYKNGFISLKKLNDQLQK